MLLYVVSLTPLAEQLQEEVPDLPKPFYADHATMVGEPWSISKGMSFLLRAGLEKGYFPEP